MVIWYIFPRFGMLYQEKFGNPVEWSQFFIYAPMTAFEDQ
jgi:hypothetical protein